MVTSIRMPGNRLAKSKTPNVRAGNLPITSFVLLVIGATTLFFYFGFRNTFVTLSRMSTEKKPTSATTTSSFFPPPPLNNDNNKTPPSTTTKTETIETPYHQLPLLVQEFGRYSPKPLASTFPETYAAGTSMREGNGGNNFWMYASTRLIDLTSVRYCADARDVCIQSEKEDGSEEIGRIVHLHPCANMLLDALYKHRQHSGHYLSKIARRLKEWSDEPYFLLGAGSQAAFSKNESRCDVGSADGPDVSAEKFRVIEEGVALLKTMQEIGWTAFFRGGFTNRVAKQAGFTHGVETGCPTLMLNKNTRLGEEVLQKKYDIVSNKGIEDRTLKLAINIVNTRYQPRLIAFFMKLIKSYPNSVVFAQGIGDLYVLKQNGIPVSRVRFFPNDAEGWVRALSQMDASIGARIHGSMAALTAGIPVYVIAPDFRVKELAETMGLPHTDVFDMRLQEENDDIVGTLFRQAAFNGRRFDQNRCAIAKMYEEQFGKVDVRVAPHVSRIAQIC